MSVDLDKLFTQLNGINSYVPSEVPDELLRGDKRMFVPTEIVAAIMAPDEASIARGDVLSNVEKARVALLNFRRLKASGVDSKDARKISWLRAGILTRTLGLTLKNENLFPTHSKRSEIVVVRNFVESPIDANGAIDNTIDDVTELFVDDFSAGDMASLCTLLPIFASIQFKKTNHHFVDSEDYKAAYRRHFSSALIEPLANDWALAKIIYAGVHWMGPFNMDMWCSAGLEKHAKYLPRGIKLKLNIFPAGTAVIGTQLAVWNAIYSFPGTHPLFEMYKPQIDLLRKLAGDIKSDPLSYHVFAQLFGKVSKLDTPEFQDDMNKVVSLAAVAQAFIESIAQGTDLAKAKALKKHAEANIGVFTVAKAAFRGELKIMTKEGRIASIADAYLKARALEKQNENVPALPAPELKPVREEARPVQVPVNPQAAQIARNVAAALQPPAPVANRVMVTLPAVKNYVDTPDKRAFVEAVFNSWLDHAYHKRTAKDNVQALARGSAVADSIFAAYDSLPDPARSLKNDTKNWVDANRPDPSTLALSIRFP